MSKVEFDCGKWLQEAEEFALPNWSALPLYGSGDDVYR